MAGNLPRRRKEKTKIGGFGFRRGRLGGGGGGRSSSSADLCLVVVVVVKDRLGWGVSPFPGQPVCAARLPTSTAAEPGPSPLWPGPREARSERTRGCPPRRSERWVLQPPFWGAGGWVWGLQQGEGKLLQARLSLTPSQGLVPLPHVPATSPSGGCAVGWGAVTLVGGLPGPPRVPAQLVSSENGCECLGLSRCCWGQAGGAFGAAEAAWFGRWQLRFILELVQISSKSGACLAF